ncbi:hypothetical protein H9P43_005273 [Blastocladiella emersonii ATCC 22665]|nr:hypothetical protein H9P43_005273 [Blastocladiella emersonii ATCC 22665]
MEESKLRADRYRRNVAEIEMEHNKALDMLNKGMAIRPPNNVVPSAAMVIAPLDAAGLMAASSSAAAPSNQ